MHSHSYLFVMIMSLIIGLFSGCTSSRVRDEALEQIVRNHAGPRTWSNFNLTLPEGWNEVHDPAQIEHRIVWEIRKSAWSEWPTFRAWDGPEQLNVFLTTMQAKRRGNLEIGTWYSEIIRFLKKIGAEIQETGVTEIDGSCCKWWVHAIAKGQIHQQCFMFGHGDYFYIFCFTTSYLSEDKMQLFEQLTKTVAVDDSLTEGDRS